MASERALVSRKVKWFAGLTLGSLATLIMWAAMSQKGTTTVHASSPVESPRAAEPAREEPTPYERIMAAGSWSSAYQVAKPYLTDSVGEPSRGAMMLALWLGHHGTWSDIYSPTPGPSIKLIKKDPERVRGQLTCLKGRINQIKRETSTLFSGTFAVGYSDMIHYFAAGDTGELVEGDRATLCGVIAGLYAYKNVGGGQTQSIQMVGMFDLRRSH